MGDTPPVIVVDGRPGPGGGDVVGMMSKEQKVQAQLILIELDGKIDRESCAWNDLLMSSMVTGFTAGVSLAESQGALLNAERAGLLLLSLAVEMDPPRWDLFSATRQVSPYREVPFSGPRNLKMLVEASRRVRRLVEGYLHTVERAWAARLVGDDRYYAVERRWYLDQILRIRRLID